MNRDGGSVRVIRVTTRSVRQDTDEIFVRHATSLALALVPSP